MSQLDTQTTPGRDITSNPETPPEGDIFPRKYVERLRQGIAEQRTRAIRADDLAASPHPARIAATDRLADPSDLPFDEALLDDDEALTAAIDAPLAVKPHLASRRPRSDVD
jgi:hypothetical protein